MYFDTHAHYDSNHFKKDRHELLASMPQQGVDLIVCPGCDVPSSRACVDLADAFPFVYATVGVHPHDAQHVPEDYLAQLEAMAAHPKVVALGEFGLDYHYNHSPKEAQQQVFREQMELAAKLNLPVVIHDREAHKDCLDMVKAFPQVKGVYHCYSGGVEDAKTLVMLDYMLSFTGAITFKNARRSLEVIEWLPMDRIMIETDAPYLTPEPWRGKRNHSGYVHRVAETIAQVKGLSVEEVARITKENGMRFFGIQEHTP